MKDIDYFLDKLDKLGCKFTLNPSGKGDERARLLHNLVLVNRPYLLKFYSEEQYVQFAGELISSVPQKYFDGTIGSLNECMIEQALNSSPILSEEPYYLRVIQAIMTRTQKLPASCTKDYPLVSALKVGAPEPIVTKLIALSEAEFTQEPEGDLSATGALESAKTLLDGLGYCKDVYKDDQITLFKSWIENRCADFKPVPEAAASTSIFNMDWLKRLSTGGSSPKPMRAPEPAKPPVPPASSKPASRVAVLPPGFMKE